jgi:hypothetical protein
MPYSGRAHKAMNSIPSHDEGKKKLAHISTKVKYHTEMDEVVFFSKLSKVINSRAPAQSVFL